LISVAGLFGANQIARAASKDTFAYRDRQAAFGKTTPAVSFRNGQYIFRSADADKHFSSSEASRYFPAITAFSLYCFAMLRKRQILIE
jgi:hypothetical protein